MTSEQPPKNLESPSQSQLAPLSDDESDYEYGVYASQEYYEGLVPPAELMAGYHEIDPTFPNRLLEMTEQQVAHRIELEKKILEGGHQLALRGQTYAYRIGMTALLVAVPIGIWGNGAAAAVAAAFGVISHITPAFFSWRENQSAKRETQDDE